MAFRFRLQRILDFRGAELTAARAVLAAAEAKLAQAQANWQGAHDERRWLFDLHAEPGRLLDATRLRSQVLSSNAARTREEAALVFVTDAEREVERLRALAIEAQRKVRALELLRERRLRAWQTEENAQERRQQDDIQGRKGGVRHLDPATLARGRG